MKDTFLVWDNVVEMFSNHNMDIQHKIQSPGYDENVCGDEADDCGSNSKIICEKRDHECGKDVAHRNAEPAELCTYEVESVQRPTCVSDLFHQCLVSQTGDTISRGCVATSKKTTSKFEELTSDTSMEKAEEKTTHSGSAVKLSEKREGATPLENTRLGSQDRLSSESVVSNSEEQLPIARECNSKSQASDPSSRSGGVRTETEELIVITDQLGSTKEKAEEIDSYFVVKNEELLDNCDLSCSESPNMVDSELPSWSINITERDASVELKREGNEVEINNKESTLMLHEKTDECDLMEHTPDLTGNITKGKQKLEAADFSWCGINKSRLNHADEEDSKESNEAEMDMLVNICSVIFQKGMQSATTPAAPGKRRFTAPDDNDIKSKRKKIINDIYRSVSLLCQVEGVSISDDEDISTLCEAYSKRSFVGHQDKVFSVASMKETDLKKHITDSQSHGSAKKCALTADQLCSDIKQELELFKDLNNGTLDWNKDIGETTLDSDGSKEQCSNETDVNIFRQIYEAEGDSSNNLEKLGEVLDLSVRPSKASETSTDDNQAVDLRIKTVDLSSNKDCSEYNDAQSKEQSFRDKPTEDTSSYVTRTNHERQNSEVSDKCSDPGGNNKDTVEERTLGDDKENNPNVAELDKPKETVVEQDNSDKTATAEHHTGQDVSPQNSGSNNYLQNIHTMTQKINVHGQRLYDILTRSIEDSVKSLVQEEAEVINDNPTLARLLAHPYNENKSKSHVRIRQPVVCMHSDEKKCLCNKHLSLDYYEALNEADSKSGNVDRTRFETSHIAVVNQVVKRQPPSRGQTTESFKRTIDTINRDNVDDSREVYVSREKKRLVENNLKNTSQHQGCSCPHQGAPLLRNILLNNASQRCPPNHHDGHVSGLGTPTMASRGQTPQRKGSSFNHHHLEKRQSLAHSTKATQHTSPDVEIVCVENTTPRNSIPQHCKAKGKPNKDRKKKALAHWQFHSVVSPSTSYFGHTTLFTNPNQSNTPQGQLWCQNSKETTPPKMVSFPKHIAPQGERRRNTFTVGNLWKKVRSRTSHTITSGSQGSKTKDGTPQMKCSATVIGPPPAAPLKRMVDKLTQESRPVKGARKPPLLHPPPPLIPISEFFSYQETPAV